MYYASFFAAQAAIRLKGTLFVRLDYGVGGVAQPPTYRLEVVNLMTNSFRVRKAGALAEHPRVWRAFFELYGGLSARPTWAEFWRVTEESDPEERLAEMHRRHLLNYVPGYGYSEVLSPKRLAELVKRAGADALEHLVESLDDLDLQLEAKAFLRLKLCLRILDQIAGQGGKYAAQHAGKREQRLRWLDGFQCPAVLRSRLASVLGPAT
jgi:hypothetical protein